DRNNSSCRRNAQRGKWRPRPNRIIPQKRANQLCYASHQREVGVRGRHALFSFLGLWGVGCFFWRWGGNQPERNRLLLVENGLAFPALSHSLFDRRTAAWARLHLLHFVHPFAVHALPDHGVLGEIRDGRNLMRP